MESLDWWPNSLVKLSITVLWGMKQIFIGQVCIVVGGGGIRHANVTKYVASYGMHVLLHMRIHKNWGAGTKRYCRGFLVYARIK